jgi:hypothetical protein
MDRWSGRDLIKMEQESAFSAEEKQIAGEIREPNKKPNVNTINLRQ